MGRFKVGCPIQADMDRLLVGFDFDGTLSESEMTVLLGTRAGVADQMRSITEAAMNDEIEYAESLRRRVGLLEGLPEAEVHDAFDAVTLRPGAADTIGTLRSHDVHVAILTGGFRRGVTAALERAGVTVDTLIANELTLRDGELTGEVTGPLIEGTKDDALRSLADDLSVAMADSIAVGDGANDLPMLEVSGLAVGFRPKPAVEPACDVVVESMAELDAVLARELAERRID